MNFLPQVFRVILMVGGLAACGTLSAADDGCEACHGDPGFFAEYRKLYDYYQAWQGSPHQQADVSCGDCHGGDPGADSVARAHIGVLPMTNPDSTLHSRLQPLTCGQCHRANRRQFEQSKHFTALMGIGLAPTCSTCHPAMGSRPELRQIVLNACRNCHAAGNENNLQLIADQAERTFQQLNIAGGLLGWSKIHFESHGWPEDSRNRVGTLADRYENILSEVHAFSLDNSETATVELLGELRTIFDAARRAHEARGQDAANEL